MFSSRKFVFGNIWSFLLSTLNHSISWSDTPLAAGVNIKTNLLPFHWFNTVVYDLEKDHWANVIRGKI